MLIEYFDKDNNLFHLRPIEPTDKVHLKLGLKELSLESRRQRFQSGKSDFNEKELKYLTEVDQKSHIAFMVFFIENKNNQIIELPAGVIRGYQNAKNLEKLEIAITIVDHYQHRGLASLLIETMAKWAINLNYTHFYGDLHSSNLKMIGLLQKFSKNRSKLIVNHKGDGFLAFEVPLK